MLHLSTVITKIATTVLKCNIRCFFAALNPWFGVSSA